MNYAAKCLSFSAFSVSAFSPFCKKTLQPCRPTYQAFPTIEQADSYSISHTNIPHCRAPCSYARQIPFHASMMVLVGLVLQKEQLTFASCSHTRNVYTSIRTVNKNNIVKKWTFTPITVSVHRYFHIYNTVSSFHITYYITLFAFFVNVFLLYSF